MITAYALADGKLAPLNVSDAIPETAVWIDVHNPTPAESAAMEKIIGAPMPTMEDLSVVSDTDRLYREDGRLHLTITVVTRNGSEHPDIADVGFILMGPRLITVRYADPTPVSKFAAAYMRQPCIAPTNIGIFVGLLEAFVNRLGEHVEANGAALYDISHDVFVRRRGRLDTPELNRYLDRIGSAGDVNAKARDSLLSIGRMQAFVAEELNQTEEKAPRKAFKAIERDVAAVSDYANFISGQLSFVLQAVVGLISIEQNRVVKIFSVIAAVFLPPTLIATVYGMNFRAMPELDWPWGYPLAMLAMIISAVIPYVYFKRKGWF